MPLLRMFNVTNMSFNAIRENKILAKISRFTEVNPQDKAIDVTTLHKKKALSLINSLNSCTMKYGYILYSVMCMPVGLDSSS